jgi:hypothetical protein
MSAVEPPPQGESWPFWLCFGLAAVGTLIALSFTRLNASAPGFILLVSCWRGLCGRIATTLIAANLDLFRGVRQPFHRSDARGIVLGEHFWRLERPVCPAE